MLGKLFKHEMKACSRLLLPMLLVLAVLSVAERIIINLHVFKGVLIVIPGIITFAYVVSLIAIGVLSTVIIILRFYKNMVTDEGYLMFTLPVKTHQLINSKLIVGTIWVVISILAIFVSLIGVFGTLDQASVVWDELKRGWSEYTAQFGANAILFIVELLGITLLGMISSILHIYASIAIGQLFNGHKILGSVAAYIGLYTVMQVVTGVLMVVAGLLSGTSIESFSTLTNAVMPISILVTLLFTVGFYVLTEIIFKKRLNLE